MPIAYKAVLVYRKKYWSIGQIQEYYLSKINRPKIAGSKLFVFDTLENAKNFIFSSVVHTCHYEIWKVKTAKLTELPVMIDLVVIRPTEVELQCFWTHPENTSIIRVNTPQGTMGTDWVKFLEKVYD